MRETNKDAHDLYKKTMRIFLEYEIGNLYHFLETLEQILNSRQQGVSLDIDEILNNDVAMFDQDDQYRKDFINLKVEAEHLKGFSNLLRKSFLMSLYSFMELWLIRECHLDSKRRDGGKSYKTIKNRGLDKVKKYFSKIMQSEYSFDTSQDWLWITNFKLLRDCIVHRRGNLSGLSDFEVDPTLFAFVHKESKLNLSGTKNKEIFIEHEFCLKSITIVHKFMSEILELEN